MAGGVLTFSCLVGLAVAAVVLAGVAFLASVCFFNSSLASFSLRSNSALRSAASLSAFSLAAFSSAAFFLAASSASFFRSAADF